MSFFLKRIYLRVGSAENLYMLSLNFHSLPFTHGSHQYAVYRYAGTGSDAFEHFFMQELVAYLGYHNSVEPLSYWRTYTGLEVDAVIGEARVAIEFKSVTEVRTSHLKNLKRFAVDFPNARLIIVTLDKLSRKMGNVESYYAYDFLKLLWKGKIV